MSASPHTRVTVLTAPERLDGSEQLVPDPGPGEVLVRVRETGLCGSDVTMYRGRHPINRPPLVLGHEFYGELLTGDHPEVAVFPVLSCDTCARCRSKAPNLCADMGIIGAQRPGALAGIVAVPERSVRAIDPQTPAGVRVLIEPLSVALHAVERAGAVEGRRCLIVGAGPIGVLAGLILRDRGAAEVCVRDTAAHRLETAQRLDVATPSQRWDGFDVAFDCVGSAAVATEAFDDLRPGGTLVLVGVQSEPTRFDGVALQRGERSVVGVQLYTMDDFENAMRLLATEPRFRELPVDELIRRNPADEIELVFTRLANGESTHLKESIVFDQSKGTRC